MAELIINTNEVIINEGKLEKDVMKKKEVNNGRHIILLEEINRKLDLLLSETEAKNGKTNH